MLVSDGALPLLTSPHGGQIPPCPLYLTAPNVARGTRGDTLVVSCTLRLPRLDDITEANSCLLPLPFQGTPLQEGGF